MRSGYTGEITFKGFKPGVVAFCLITAAKLTKKEMAYIMSVLTILESKRQFILQDSLYDKLRL